MSDDGDREGRKFGVVMTGALALGVALLALAYALFAGSGDAAQTFAEALRQGKPEEAASLCEPAVLPRLAALSWLQVSVGSVEVERGTAGLWHDGFVPYACYEIRREQRAVTVILLRREGVWRVHETFLDHRPEACDPGP